MKTPLSTPSLPVMSELGQDFTRVDHCRVCASTDLAVILDYGGMPLADALVEPNADRSREPVYPLTLVRCEHCSLVQILETVAPKTLFGDDYPYYSSFSDALVKHAKSCVDQVLERTGVGADSLVVELASNDGYLLQWFVEQGVPVLGVDPAPGPASAALARGIPTICEFFDVALAERLVGEGKKADVIIGNNVLAHVPDQNEFVKAMGILLKPGGTIVMEFPYVRDLIDHVEFDTVYHEHHCYFSVSTVSELFRRHGLELVSVQHLDIHGGSLRVFFRRDTQADSSVVNLLDEERREGLLAADYYDRFSERVIQLKSELLAMLDGLREDGARIAGYGAAAKGAVLLNYCGVGSDYLDYVVDRNTYKHGWEMPGVPIPIVGPDRLVTHPPDYLLVLAWNFKDEIMAQQRAYAQHGGRFIIPVPTPRIV